MTTRVPGPFTDEALEHLFTYHSPRPDQVERYARLRASALQFAHVVRDMTPPGPDQSTAIRKLRECVMTANAAIALGPKP